MQHPGHEAERRVLHVPREEGAQLPVSRARPIRWIWGVLPIVVAIGCSRCARVVTTAPLDQLAPVARELRDPPGTTRAQALYIARGGPVIVGFQSDAPRSLDVGRSSTSSAGAASSRTRIVLPAGPIAIRLRRAGRCAPRVEPGRSPRRSRIRARRARCRPTDGRLRQRRRRVAARRRDRAAAAHRDRRVRCMLARRRLRARVARDVARDRRRLRRSRCIVRWLGLCGVRPNVGRGRQLGAPAATTSRTCSRSIFRRASWTWNFEHPPVMKYLDGIGAQFADGFGPARALSAVWTVARLRAARADRRAALLACASACSPRVIAALLPPLVAHGQIVGHESPTVLWWSLGDPARARVHDDPARTRRPPRLARRRDRHRGRVAVRQRPRSACSRSRSS